MVVVSVEIETCFFFFFVGGVKKDSMVNWLDLVGVVLALLPALLVASEETDAATGVTVEAISEGWGRGGEGLEPFEVASRCCWGLLGGVWRTGAVAGAVRARA